MVFDIHSILSHYLHYLIKYLELICCYMIVCALNSRAKGLVSDPQWTWDARHGQALVWVVKKIVSEYRIGFIGCPQSRFM